MLGLETMAEGDPTSLGMSACQALRRHGGQDQLERLIAVRPKLPQRKGMRDWRRDADHATEVVRARAAGVCTCAAEAAGGASYDDPQWQVAEHDDYIRVTATCTACGRRWSVERQDGYHFPRFSWTALD